MKLIKLIVMLFGASFVFDAPAQTNFVTVTNFVNITITNVVTVTNVVAPLQAATKVAAAPPAHSKIAPPPGIPWVSSISAGLTLTRGNSDTLLTTGRFATEKKTPFNDYTLGVDGAYGSANGVANTELYHGFGQWNALFDGKWYAYLRGEGLHDGIADIKYRATVTSGLGYNLIKQTNTTLALEAGPGMVIERQGENDTTYATMRLAERFEHKFNKSSARIWENAEFLPQVDKPGDYLVNSEIGAASALYKSLSLQVYLDDNYNSQPASGFKRNDLKLVSGVNYAF